MSLQYPWSQGPAAKLPNNGSCVCASSLIRRPALRFLLVSSPFSCPLVAAPSFLLPCSLCLCAQRPFPRWKGEEIRAGKTAGREKQKRKVIRRETMSALIACELLCACTVCIRPCYCVSLDLYSYVLYSNHSFELHWWPGRWKRGKDVKNLLMNPHFTPLASFPSFY